MKLNFTWLGLQTESRNIVCSREVLGSLVYKEQKLKFAKENVFPRGEANVQVLGKTY